MSKVKAQSKSPWHRFDPEDKDTWPPDGKMVLCIYTFRSQAEYGFLLRDGCDLAVYDDVYKTTTHWAELPAMPEL